jgi:hypothetical protein
MDLESTIVQLNRFITQRLQVLSLSVTSGGIDNIEREMLDNKERKNEGTVIDIKPKSSKT